MVHLLREGGVKTLYQMQQGNFINNHAAKLGRRQKRSRRRLKIWSVRSSQIIKVNYLTQGLQNKNVPNNRAEYMKCFCKTGG